jgi:hypothetical protein
VLRLGASSVAIWLLSAGATAPLPPSEPAPVTPKEHQRGAEQTFLTFPEWFLVFSPAEYAAFVKHGPPSEFPFIGHIAQFWQNYAAVTEATKPYPFNLGYHVMIVVIGTSTTVEYAIRSVYETLIGRPAEFTRTHGMTDEEKFAARVAQDYVDFIRVYPWYEYDFRDKLAGVWRESSLSGPDALRKWERKYALSSEYGAKAVYGWLIKKATKAAYDTPIPVTAVLLDRLPNGIGQELPQLRPLQRFADGSVLVTVPRYDDFMKYAIALAKRGVSFREIAGNRSAILISVLTARTWEPAIGDLHVLFSQPIITQPSTKRVALVVPVAALASTLNRVIAQGGQIEHVFDY